MAYSNVTPPTLPDYNPVSGYSYNGTVLPKLPEWDKTAYPYAVIGKVSNYPDVYILVMGENAPTYSGDTEKVTIAMTNTNEPLQIAKCVSPYSAWGGVEDWSYYMCDFWTDLYWTSTDILSTDGTIYLAASEPVPIEPYPYSVIAYNYEKGAEDWYQAHLYYSATPFTWNGTAVVNGGTTYKRIYDAEFDAWTDEAETEIEATPGLDDTVYQRIYTDHDILDSTGAVWLAAGQVTPVEETGVSDTWKYSFKLGLALGLCCKPLPIVRKLIGYSYNGTVLPKLPEVDKTVYPYHYIIGLDTRYLVLSSTAKTANSSGYVSVGSNNENQIVFVLQDETWVTFGSSATYRTLIWCSEDVYYASGEILMEASKPVPIYK